MHHIYHTDAFILKSRNLREADKLLYLYTKDLGLVRAKAQGIRKLSSKLRFALQDYSLAKVDLVRGRDSWRVTSAETIERFEYVRSNKKLFEIFHNTSMLLMRLSDGEVPHPAIFEDLKKTLIYLNQENLEPNKQRSSELFLIFRILHTLGYISGAIDTLSYLERDIAVSEVSFIPKEERAIIFEINRALRASQL